MVYTASLGKQGNMVYTIGPERRAQQTPKKERGGILCWWPEGLSYLFIYIHIYICCSVRLWDAFSSLCIQTWGRWLRSKMGRAAYKPRRPQFLQCFVVLRWNDFLAVFAPEGPKQAILAVAA